MMPGMPSAPILVVGSAAVDEQVSPEGVVRVQLGGVVTYGAATFVREGLRATAVCNLEARSEPAIRSAFERLGIEVCAGASGSRTGFQNTLLGDGGRRQRIESLADPIGDALVSAALEGIEAPHVHLGPLHGADIDAGALAVIAARADLVTLDVQGFVRRGGVGPVRAEATPLLDAALAAAHVVKADEAELDVVLRAYTVDPERLLERFEIQEIVVTAGRAGGYVVGTSGGRDSYRAAFAEHEGDTTGAGDVFFAAYVAARLHRGATSSAAAQHASAVAAQHVAGVLLREGDLKLTFEGVRR